MKTKTYRFIYALISTLVLILLCSAQLSAQRINPATRIQKAPDQGYILMSDAESEYRHARLDTTIAGGSVSIDTFTFSNDTLYLSLSGDGEPVRSVIVTGASTDDQIIDTLLLQGDTMLLISLENDGQPALVLDLSALLDNTDAQTLSYNASTNEITISGGNTIDISELDTDTDKQTVDTFALQGATLTLALERDGEAPYTVDLSSLSDGTGTDDQTLFLSGTSLSIEDGNSVDLSALLDNTDNQQVDSFYISGDTLIFALENDGQPPHTVVIPPGIDSLNQLLDVDAAPTTGQVLQWNGLLWVAGTVTSGGDADSDPGNEIQAISYNAATDEITLSLGGGTIDITEVDTDRQTVDTFALQGNNLTLALERDGEAPYTVDLSPFLDNTDTQTLTLDGANLSISGGNSVNLSSLGGGSDNQTVDTFAISANILTLTLERDGEAPYNVDLSPYLDNTDAQTLSIVEGSLVISGGNSVSLSPYLDNTDNQTVDTFTLSGTVLTLALERDGEAPYTVDLSSLVGGGTDDQIIDTFALVGNTLQISLENDGVPVETINLSGYMDNTDDQVLELTGTVLAIEDGNSVDLANIDTDKQAVDSFLIVSNTLILALERDAEAPYTVNLAPYLDNTDAQTLSLTGSSLSISNGNSVNLSSIDTDDQTLSYSGAGALSIAGGNSVDLSDLLDNTDNQQLVLSGNLLSITGGNTVNLTPYLDNTDNQKIDTFALVGTELQISLESDGELYKSVDLSELLDDDWRFISGTTINDPIWRNGRVNIATQANSHGFRADTSFQFNVYGNAATFDWQDGTGISQNPGLVWSAPGAVDGTNSATFAGKNNLLLQSNNGTAVGHSLGLIGFGAENPANEGKHKTSAAIKALADKAWTTGGTGSIMEFYVTGAADTSMHLVATFQTTGRMQLDQYHLINDGLPTYLLGHNNSSKQVERHPIGGTPDNGDVLKIVSGNLEWAADGGAAASVDLNLLRDTITQVGHGFNTANLPIPVAIERNTGTLFAASANNVDSLHSAFVVGIIDANTLIVATQGIYVAPTYHGRYIGRDYFLTSTALLYDTLSGNTIFNDWVFSVLDSTRLLLRAARPYAPGDVVSGGGFFVSDDAAAVDEIPAGDTLAIFGTGIKTEMQLDTLRLALDIVELTEGTPGNADWLAWQDNTTGALRKVAVTNLPSGAGDNWGSQVVQTTARLSGNGTAGSPLDIAQQSASSGQVLKWNGSVWAPGNDTDTDAQTLSITEGTRELSISGGNTIDLSEAIQEEVNAVIVAGVGISKSYDDGANTLTITNTGDTNANDDLTTATTFSGDVSGTYNSTVVADDSHNHSATTISTNIVSSLDGVINDGGNIDLIAGGIVTITPNDGANTITISATEVDGSTTNELQTLSFSGTSLSISGGNSADLEYFEADAMDSQTSGTVNLGSEKQYARIIDMTGLSNITITLSNPLDGGAYILLFTNADNGDTVTWPASVKFENNTSIGTGILSDGRRMVQMLYDGTTYWVPGGY